MNEIVKDFLNLNPGQKKKIHILLCEHALPVWLDYTSKHEIICYIESVCGTSQIVDKNLPADALASVKSNSDLLQVNKRYLEPLAALQDEDLEFPEPVEFAYYAIYNLYQKYICNINIDDWLIVNQALASDSNVYHSINLFKEALKNIK